MMVTTTRTTRRVPRHLNTWWKFMSTSNNKSDGEPTGTYWLHNVDGERELYSKATKAKAVTLKVPIGQIALLIKKMNKDDSLPNSHDETSFT